jgi:hypothetical protein
MEGREGGGGREGKGAPTARRLTTLAPSCMARRLITPAWTSGVRMSELSLEARRMSPSLALGVRRRMRRRRPGGLEEVARAAGHRGDGGAEEKSNCICCWSVGAGAI